MEKKLLYESPQVDLVHLATEGAILDGSVNASGADVSFESSSSFDDFFNPIVP